MTADPKTDREKALAHLRTAERMLDAYNAGAEQDFPDRPIRLIEVRVQIAQAYATLDAAVRHV